MDEDRAIMDGIIRDANERMDNLEKCIGQEIGQVEANSFDNAMQGAFIEFDHARSWNEDHTDTGLDRYDVAWREFHKVAKTFADDLDKNSHYFAQSLLPIQNFAKSFLLLAFDYLVYLYKESPSNYQNHLDDTRSAFEILVTWELTARQTILAS